MQAQETVSNSVTASEQPATMTEEVKAEVG